MRKSTKTIAPVVIADAVIILEPDQIETLENEGGIVAETPVIAEEVDVIAALAELDALEPTVIVVAAIDEEEPAEPTEVKSMRETVVGYADEDVAVMVKAIDDSLDRREAFELAQGPVLTGSSWDKARKQIAANRGGLARMFMALGVTPSAVFERQVVQGKMFNAKAIKKIVELAQYVGQPAATKPKLERVTRAFIACALLADQTNPGSPITNAVNARFLGRKDLACHIKDQDILDNIEDLRHRAMTTGAETQSSQARNVLDVLGLGRVTTVTRARDAVVIDAEAPLFAMFRQDYMITA